MSENQDSQLYATLVSLADTVISDFDVVDVADLLVHSCLDLIDVDSVGIMVDDQRGALRVLASTNEEAQMLELLELQSDGGPCLEAFNTGLTS